MIYLDAAASTPLMPGAINYIAEHVLTGNPSSQHASGLYLYDQIESARSTLSSFFGAKNSNLYFTSGATESAALIAKISPNRMGTITEHSCVSSAFTPYIMVNECGQVNIDQLEHIIKINLRGFSKKLMVAAMLINNETGTSPYNIDDLRTLRQKYDFILVGDAVAATPHKYLDFDNSPYDIAFVSGHKMHALAGIGAVLSKIRMEPLLQGGHQEFGVRPGTPNIAGIFSMKYATEQLQTEPYKAKLAGLSQLLEIFKTLPYEKNGVCDSSHIINMWIKKPSILAVQQLSEAGIAVSGGSACNSGLDQPSRVLSAMFKTVTMRASESIRISVSALTEHSEVLTAVRIIKEAIEAI